MAKIQQINVKDIIIRTMKVGEADYICIADIARRKNPIERKRWRHLCATESSQQIQQDSHSANDRTGRSWK